MTTHSSDARFRVQAAGTFPKVTITLDLPLQPEEYTQEVVNSIKEDLYKQMWDAIRANQAPKNTP